ncbi:hypothetical protein HDU67_006420 [Dinochytrium kinnereticum]|nr:hypothetical protein HDU67_006420 [Dinochytrium kinnereticum]
MRALKVDCDEKTKAQQFQIENLEAALSHLSEELSKVRIERKSIFDQNIILQEEARVLHIDAAEVKATLNETQALADSLEMNLTTLAQEHSSLKMAYEQLAESKSDVENKLDETLARLLTTENEKGRLTLTVTEITENWEKTKIRMGDLHHQVVITKEENERFEDELNQARNEVKTREYKIKELQLMVDTMMRFPDISLGQLADEPGKQGRFDVNSYEM